MIQAMKVDGRKRRGAMTKEITYQRVLLAVYMLSDDDGLVCGASNARIGRECGHGARAVSVALAEMRYRGVMLDFDSRDGLSSRKIVLMDHPDADALVEHITRAYNCRDRGGWR